VGGSEISVAGGANGGDGGTVEVCASEMPAFHTKIDGSAQAGYVGGTLWLDPDYIILGGSAGSSADTLYLNVNSAFTGLSQITLQAKYDITLAKGTVWNLSGSTLQGSGQLTLQAGRNIIFDSDASGNSSTAITDAGNWSVTLQAGYDFVNQSGTYGQGSIYLGGAPGTAGTAGRNRRWRHA